MNVVLTRDYAKNVVARAVPGAFFDREAKAFVLKDPTPRAAAVALRLFPDVATTYPELVDLRASLAQEVRPFDNASAYYASTPPDSDLTFATGVHKVMASEDKDLYAYQEIDLQYLAAILKTHGAAYLGWERGLGKTLGACALVDELDCRRVLVVCPNTAKRAVWEPELHRFLPDHEVVCLRNSKTQREKDLGYVRQLIQAEQPFALVVHYESLAIIEGERGGGWKKLGEWDMVIADEAHRIANPKAKMTRALKKVPAKYKLALSGTIIGNNLEELFSPLQWLFPKMYRSKWRDFSDRFLDYVDSGYARVCVGVKIEMLDALRQELGVFMVVRTKADELDLPPRTEETLYVELSAAQRKAYDDLRESCIAELDDGSVVRAEDGLVLLGRLRQVATGLNLLTGQLADSSKQDLAMEIITDNPDQEFVVFGWFRASLHGMADRLEAAGIEYFLVDGEVKQQDRAERIAAFQAGVGRVFLGSLSTLGESVTLHRAANVISLDRAWNPGVNDQAWDRVYRIGQERPVTVSHIVAKNTVDELRVMPVVSDKAAMRRLVLGS